MSLTFLSALLMQFVMVVLIRHRLGWRWLRRPVTVFVLTSVVCLGVAPALLAIPSVGSYDNFRLGLQRGYIDSADLIMSAALLAFTLAYLVTRPEQTVTRGARYDVPDMAKVLDWRWLALACVPLTVMTAAGRGYSSGQASGPGTATSTSLVATFFVIMVVVTSAGFLLRRGTRWFLPVLIVQSMVLAIAGERSPVLMDAVALVLMLLFAGVRVPRAQLMGAVLLTAVTLLSIAGVREHHGRGIFYTNSGISARVGALATGLSGGDSSGGVEAPGLVAQFAVRTATVDYGGAILQALGEGQSRLSPAYVPESLLLAVPSFLWPAKLDRGSALLPNQLQMDAFGLQKTNFISGTAGQYFGFLSPAWLVMLFSFLGIIFGRFERWLLRERTPSRMVLLAGAVLAAFGSPAGVPTMLLQMRSAGVIALIACAVAFLRLPDRAKPLDSATAAPARPSAFARLK